MYEDVQSPVHSHPISRSLNSFKTEQKKQRNLPNTTFFSLENFNNHYSDTSVFPKTEIWGKSASSRFYLYLYSFNLPKCDIRHRHALGQKVQNLTWVAWLDDDENVEAKKWAGPWVTTYSIFSRWAWLGWCGANTWGCAPGKRPRPLLLFLFISQVWKQQWLGGINVLDSGIKQNKPLLV